MEAARSSETLVSTYMSKQRYFLEKHSPEDGGSTLLRNAGIYLQVQAALLPTKAQPWRWRQHVPPNAGIYLHASQ
jgi:predicted metal-binding protein